VDRFNRSSSDVFIRQVYIVSDELPPPSSSYARGSRIFHWPILSTTAVITKSTHESRHNSNNDAAYVLRLLRGRIGSR
jgi:hypothetical protein